jgi:hypothetical protein
MSFKKVAAIAVAAGALAAISVPAMAFENEFHGFYKMKYFLSNYENGGGGNPLLPAVSFATGVTSGIGVPTGNAAPFAAPAAVVNVFPGSENLKTNNYFEQRARLFYTAKASDDLKLVTGFEIDSVWGDYAQGGFTRNAAGNNTGTVNAGTAFRNSGGAMESDAVNLETKWVYLDFKIPSTPVQAKVGIQAMKDSLKGIFLDADLAGIVTSSKVGAATINVGYARAYDQSYFSTSKVRGQEDLHFGILEGKMAVSKDLNLGAVYYISADQRNGGNGQALTTPLAGNLASPTYSSMAINVFGLTADAKVGPVDLSGFVATQFGIIKGVGSNPNALGNAYQQAFAYNLAAKMAAGPGTFRSALLFTSGQGEGVSNNRINGWYGTQYSSNVTNQGYTNTAANTYNESNMMLLNRSASMQGTTTDNSIVYQSGNGTNPFNSQGLYLLTVGYDAKITPKLYVNGNLGAAWTAKSNYLKPVDRGAAFNPVTGTFTSQKNGSNYMGTELNVETGYKMYDNLTASLQAAYVMLGGYYHNSSVAGSAATGFNAPQNPYTVRTCLTYAF